MEISEDDARYGMKQSGMSDGLIDVIIDSLNYINRGQYGSQTSETIEQITGRKPTVFRQFVREHIHNLR